MNLIMQLESLKETSYRLPGLSIDVRNAVLDGMVRNIDENRSEILHANMLDTDAAEKANIGSALLKRLVVNEKKIDSMLDGIRDLRKISDPLNVVLLKRELDRGLLLRKITVPIGVIGNIFESRPDALVQICSLCIKSANAVILKGGKEANNTNHTLFEFILQAAENADPLVASGLAIVDTRNEILELLKYDRYIDLLIPRGSGNLVRFIKENTKIPVLGHSDGICHIYVDKEADVNKAVDIVFDAKCQYPAVCNAVETLLVHETAAAVFLPKLEERLVDVQLRCDEKSLPFMKRAVPAAETDWSEEYNDLILAVKIVASVEEAVGHINTYGSHHTDGVVTENDLTASFFTSNVDSSSVMVNCSTRMADGYRYGFGAEVGISTNKIHARGPVGLEGLLTYKYILTGSGHVVRDYADGRKKFTHRDLG